MVDSSLVVDLWGRRRLPGRALTKTKLNSVGLGVKVFFRKTQKNIYTE